MSKSAVISEVDGSILRESGPWIKKKHYYLTEYAKIFTIGMGKKWRNLTYIDLFAGPGRCIIKSVQDEFDGSPLLMLQHKFSHYIFVEQDKKIMEALQRRCASSPKNSK